MERTRCGRDIEVDAPAGVVICGSCADRLRQEEDAEKMAALLHPGEKPHPRAIDHAMNICSYCKNYANFPECLPDVEQVEYGCGVGNDNITYCVGYDGDPSILESSKGEKPPVLDQLDVCAWKRKKLGFPDDKRVETTDTDSREAQRDADLAWHNKWYGGLLAEFKRIKVERAELLDQVKQVQQEGELVACFNCTSPIPAKDAYKCYHCGTFFCKKCAGEHFKEPLTDSQRVKSARQETARDLGEGLCVLIGNLMLEDKEAGTKLGNQLEPFIKYQVKSKYLDVNILPGDTERD